MAALQKQKKSEPPAIPTPGGNISARAVSRFIRISPRKVRLVLGLIRRKRAEEAFSILANTKKRAARIVEKVLRSACANARQKKLDLNRLYVRLACADGGPVMKRYLPRSMGRADQLLKRSSHITLIVEEGALRAPRARKGSGPSQTQWYEGLFQKAAKKEAEAEAVETA